MFIRINIKYKQLRLCMYRLHQKFQALNLRTLNSCAWKVCLKLSSNQDFGFICVLEDLMKSLDKCFSFIILMFFVSKHKLGVSLFLDHFFIASSPKITYINHYKPFVACVQVLFKTAFY